MPWKARFLLGERARTSRSRHCTGDKRCWHMSIKLELSCPRPLAAPWLPTFELQWLASRTLGFERTVRDVPSGSFVSISLTAFIGIESGGAMLPPFPLLVCGRDEPWPTKFGTLLAPELAVERDERVNPDGDVLLARQEGETDESIFTHRFGDSGISKLLIVLVWQT